MNLHRRPLLNNLNETRLLDGEATIQQNHTKLNMSNQKEPHRTIRNHKRYAFFLHPFLGKKLSFHFHRIAQFRTESQSVITVSLKNHQANGRRKVLFQLKNLVKGELGLMLSAQICPKRNNIWK